MIVCMPSFLLLVMDQTSLLKTLAILGVEVLHRT
jgi:hypothetical protein